jgi:hypothetical protein
VAIDYVIFWPNRAIPYSAMAIVENRLQKDIEINANYMVVPDELKEAKVNLEY